MTDNKDNGLRKAARQNHTPRLSSNFTYRTMKRIAEEMYLREKRQEKRMFILMIITVACMFTGCIGMVVWAYGKEIAEALYIMTRTFIAHILSSHADSLASIANFRPLVKT